MRQGFPMNNIWLYLLIESSLVHLQCTCISHLCAKRASNGSCCCWKFLRQFARPDYSTPVITLLAGQHYRATQSS